MTPDELEAKSWRFGDRSILLVPLSSKYWAIYDRWGTELLGFVKFESPTIQSLLLESSEKSLFINDEKELIPTSLSSSKTATELGL